MADPKVGNAADELGQHLEGVDFAAVNVSAVPDEVDPIEVEVKHDGRNILMVPKRGTGSLEQGVGELQEGAREQLAAAIFEDSSMGNRVSGNLQRRSQRGQLQYFAIRDTVACAVFGDRVLVKRDTMESAYSCRYCKGTGHSATVCPTCKGNRIGIDAPEIGCRSCQVLGYEREVKHACGFVPCEHCFGAGHPAGIVIPETAKSAPISGIIVSCGPDCVNLQLGDRVLHSRYAGHQLDTPDGESYTTMHEHEVLQLLREIHR